MTVSVLPEKIPGKDALFSRNYAEFQLPIDINFCRKNTLSYERF